MKKKKNEFFIVSVEDTKKYGLVSACIIGRIKWWCKFHQKNKDHDKYKENEWWSGFMKYEEFAQQTGIPLKTIERHIPKLIKNNIIIKGNFNSKKYDRTGWYRINLTPQNEGNNPSKWGDGYPQNEGMDTSKWGDGYPQNEGMDTLKMRGPIPVSPAKQYVNPSVNSSASISAINKIELTDLEKNDLLKTLQDVRAPKEAKEKLELLITSGIDCLTKNGRELILANKNYLNQNNVFEKVIAQLE